MRETDLRLHLVTDERLAFPRLLRVVDAAVEGGVTVVQLRAKRLTAREMLAQLVSLADLLAGRAVLVVNDRLDVALAARDAGAAVRGIHLGQGDVPPVTARRALGPDALVGWSADRAAHLRELGSMPAGTVDYLGVGVIRATGTKADHPPVLGVAGFGEIAAASPVPCVAIGGVTAADVPAVRAAGGAGVAVVSAICGAADPRAAAAALTGAGIPPERKVRS